VDLKTLLRISTATFYLWPLVLVAVVAILRRHRLQSRIAFWVLGYLVCAGVQSLVRGIGYTFSWIHVAAVPQEQILVALVNASLSITVVAVLVSIAPVVWLSRVCAQGVTGPS
jgi:hypothetical protein